MAVVDNLRIALEKLNGSGDLDQIYKSYEDVTGSVVKSTIRRTLQQYSSDTTTYIGREDYFFSVEGIGKGIWGLRNFEITNDTNVDGGNENPHRTLIVSQRIVRDTALAVEVKKLVGFKCQLCETQIPLKNGKLYIEAHHIEPLGSPYNGPDIKENILVVCPNCHINCDYATFEMSFGQIKNNIQGIKEEFINHHNSRYQSNL